MVISAVEKINWHTELSALVSPLTARLNRDVIAGIATMLSDTLMLPHGIRSHEPEEVAKVLQTNLLRLLTQWRGEEEKLVSDLRQWRELYYRTPDAEGRREILEKHVVGSSVSRLQSYLDRMALKSTLDWEALEERLSFSRWSLWMKQQVALEAIEGLYLSQAERPGSLDAGGAFHNHSALASSIMTYIKSEPYDFLQKFAVMALKAILTASAEINENFFAMHRRALVRMLTDVQLNRWVRTGIIALLCLDNTGDNRQLFLDMSRNTPEDGDGFVIRAHAVQAYCRNSGISELQTELPVLMGSSDVGEYVRLAVIKGLDSIEGEGAVDLLMSVAEAENARPDSEFTVRARLAEAMAAKLPSISFESHSAINSSRMLGRWAAQDESAIVRRVAQEEIARIVPGLAWKGAWGLCANMVSALVRRFNAGTAPGESERIAGILEEIRISINREYAGERAALLQKLNSTAWGGRFKRAFPEGVRDIEEYMRIAADISRSEAGIYVSEKSGRLTIQKGERFETKLWRTLHEVGDLHPNMRPDISHTRGRRYAQRYRAHPQQLAEINPTQVPGERRYSENEGGWARYLPTIDDLLEADRRGIRLFSSYGVTVVKAPASALKRMRAWISLTLNYAEWSSLRNQVLALDEEWRKREFVQKLEKSLGFEITFKPWSYDLFGVNVNLASSRVADYFGKEVGGE